MDFFIRIRPGNVHILPFSPPGSPIRRRIREFRVTGKPAGITIIALSTRAEGKTTDFMPFHIPEPV
jgi:hypothetical protein